MEVKVLVLTIEENGRRIRLSHAKALEHEERAETQAYLKDTKPPGSFGITLGERVQRRTGRL
jgi:predicted RNA-binding protein with RPS1 domain